MMGAGWGIAGMVRWRWSQGHKGVQLSVEGEVGHNGLGVGRGGICTPGLGRRVGGDGELPCKPAPLRRVRH